MQDQDEGFRNATEETRIEDGNSDQVNVIYISFRHLTRCFITDKIDKRGIKIATSLAMFNNVFCTVTSFTMFFDVADYCRILLRCYILIDQWHILQANLNESYKGNTFMFCE